MLCNSCRRRRELHRILAHPEKHGKDVSDSLRNFDLKQFGTFGSQVPPVTFQTDLSSVWNVWPFRLNYLEFQSLITYSHSRFSNNSSRTLSCRSHSYILFWNPVNWNLKHFENFESILIVMTMLLKNWVISSSVNPKKTTLQKYRNRAFQNFKNYQNRFRELGKRSVYFLPKKKERPGPLKKIIAISTPECS